MSGRAIIFLLATLALSGRGAHNLTFQELLGPAAPGAGDAIRRRPAFMPWWDRAAAAGATARSSPAKAPPPSGPSRPARADPAAMAAARLCRRDAVRRDHERAAHGVRRTFLQRRRGLRGWSRFVVIWFAYALIYRWQRENRFSDEAVDAALTRLAWPAFRLMQPRGADARWDRARPAEALALSVVLPIETAANHRS